MRSVFGLWHNVKKENVVREVEAKMKVFVHGAREGEKIKSVGVVTIFPEIFEKVDLFVCGLALVLIYSIQKPCCW